MPDAGGNFVLKRDALFSAQCSDFGKHPFIVFFGPRDDIEAEIWNGFLLQGRRKGIDCVKVGAHAHNPTNRNSLGQRQPDGQAAALRETAQHDPVRVDREFAAAGSI